jgi:preprotein translocase subunit SecA
VATHHEDRDFEEYKLALLKTFAIEPKSTADEFLSANKEQLTEELFDRVYGNYRQKCELLANRAHPVIRDVYENHPRYENIAIPITDGIKSMQVVANLKKAYTDKGREITLAIEKGVTLGVIDDAWKDHLREMDELRSSVQNATYEQKDPLLIYKFESFELFKTLLQKVNRDITAFIVKANLPVQESSQVKEAHMPRRSDNSKLKEERTDLLSQAGRTAEPQVATPVRVEKKVGRNDLCPCGSGKKYKNCHGLME